NRPVLREAGCSPSGKEDLWPGFQAILVASAADIGDLFQRSKIFVVDVELIVSIRQLEVGAARLRDYIELSASRFLKCRKRFRPRNTPAREVFAGNGNQLLKTERLIHEGIRRNIDKAPDARFAGNA